MTKRQAQFKHRASLRTGQPAANRWDEAAPVSIALPFAPSTSGELSATPRGCAPASRGELAPAGGSPPLTTWVRPGPDCTCISPVAV